MCEPWGLDTELRACAGEVEAKMADDAGLITEEQIRAAFLQGERISVRCLTYPPLRGMH